MLKSGVCEVAVVSERLAGEDNRLIWVSVCKLGKTSWERIYDFTSGNEIIHSFLKVSFSDLFKIYCFCNMYMDTFDVSTRWLLF